MTASVSRAIGQAGEPSQVHPSSKFSPKPSYSKRDLLDTYEARRFDGPFVVYRWMDWWPFFDILATYGHFVNNFIIVFIAV